MFSIHFLFNDKGRDGRSATAISLIIPEDVQSRLSLAHSDGISRCQLKTLLLILRHQVDVAISKLTTLSKTQETNSIFLPCSELDITLPISSLANAVDCRAETLETIFSLLEDDEVFGSPFLSVCGNLFDLAIVTLKRRTLSKLAIDEPIADAIAKCGKRIDVDSSNDKSPLQQSLVSNGGTALQHGFYAYSLGTYQLSVLDCAKHLGPDAEPRHVYATLRRLQSEGELEVAIDTSISGKGIHLRLTADGVAKMRSPTQCTNETENIIFDENKDQVSASGLDEIIDILSTHFEQQESTCLLKVKKIYYILSQISKQDYDINDQKSYANHKSSRASVFKEFLRSYFLEDSFNTTALSSTEKVLENSKTFDVPTNITKELTPEQLAEVAELTRDAMVILRNTSLTNFSSTTPINVHFGSSNFIEYTARCIAKILHSIDTPRAPIKGWFHHPLWGKWRGTSFTSVYDVIIRFLKETNYFDSI